MVTSASDWSISNTEHGLLVAFGEFFQQHGLRKQLMRVPIPQKTATCQPQTKRVEFLAGIMSGIEYLSDLNDGSHPLAKDTIVAQAWQQALRALQRCESHAQGVYAKNRRCGATGN